MHIICILFLYFYLNATPKRFTEILNQPKYSGLEAEPKWVWIEIRKYGLLRLKDCRWVFLIVYFLQAKEAWNDNSEGWSCIGYSFSFLWEIAFGSCDLDILLAISNNEMFIAHDFLFCLSNMNIIL